MTRSSASTRQQSCHVQPNEQHGVQWLYAFGHFFQEEVQVLDVLEPYDRDSQTAHTRKEPVHQSVSAMREELTGTAPEMSCKNISWLHRSGAFQS